MTDRYTYSVVWSAPDHEFVATCAEFRSLSHLDETAEAALAGIRALVADVVAELADEGAPIPRPLAERGHVSQAGRKWPTKATRPAHGHYTERDTSYRRLNQLIQRSAAS